MNNNSMNASDIGAYIVMVIVVLIFAVRILHLESEAKKLKQDMSHYETTYLRKQGSTSLWKGSAGNFLTYELRSFDGGKKWYVTKFNNDGELVITGEADTIYPGLLSHLQGMDALFDTVMKEGPLDLGNPISVQLLKRAGFDVVSSTNK